MAQRLTKEEFICPDCSHIGHAALLLRGSAAVERILWYVFLIPGPFYSLWRRMDKRIACPDCKSQSLVPLDSKLGGIMLEKRLQARKQQRPDTSPDS